MTMRMATDPRPGQPEHHLRIRAGDVGRYVLLPGDPGRTDVIAGHLDDARLVASNREFRTWTGTLAGAPVSVTSTGIGGPSTAIAVRELARVGADTFLRVGTCGALQSNVRAGYVVIASGAVRDEGTTRQYVPIEFPAVAHHEVVAGLRDAATEQQQPHVTGIVYCKDALTAAFPPDDIPLFEPLMERSRVWVKAGVLVSEMESATIFVLASIAGHRAGSVLSVVGPDDDDDPARLEPVVKIAVGAIARLVAADRQIDHAAGAGGTST